MEITEVETREPGRMAYFKDFYQGKLGSWFKIGTLRGLDALQTATVVSIAIGILLLLAVYLHRSRSDRRTLHWRSRGELSTQQHDLVIGSTSLDQLAVSLDSVWSMKWFWAIFLWVLLRDIPSTGNGTSDDDGTTFLSSLDYLVPFVISSVAILDILQNYVRQKPSVPSWPKMAPFVFHMKFNELWIPIVAETVDPVSSPLFYWRTNIVPANVTRWTWSCTCGKTFSQSVSPQIVAKSAEIQQLERSIKEKLLKKFDYLVSPYKTSHTSETTRYPISSNEETSRRPSALSKDVMATQGAGSERSSSRKRPRDDPDGVNGSSSPAHDLGAESSNNDGDLVDEIPKWLIAVMPENGVNTVKHINLDANASDLVIMKEVRNLFKQANSRRRKLLRLHDIQNIRVAKFDLRKGSQRQGNARKAVDVPGKLEPYTLPDRQNHPNWRVDAQEISIDSLPGLLMRLWHEAGHDETASTQLQPRREQDDRWYRSLLSFFTESPRIPRLPTHSSPAKKPDHWYNHILQISVYIHKPSKLYIHENINLEDLSIGIDIELDSDAFHITEEVPRRIREQLRSDPQGRRTVLGWGLWVEEGWVVPWYAFAIENIIPAATLIAGLALTAKDGIGSMAIAAYGVALLGLLRAQWTAKTKDSKG